MNLAAVNEATKEMNNTDHVFTENEKNFVVHFAFACGDMDETVALIGALSRAKNEDETKQLMKDYGDKLEKKPSWVEQVENLLIALEMYRTEEERAVNRLAEILNAYGIDVSEDEIRTTETEVLRTTVREKVEVR